MTLPKDSCVEHPQGYFLCLRRDYIEMVDDHCAAVLLAYFEFMTNGELTRIRNAGENTKPWVKASMRSIAEETLGLYSVRALQERLDQLESSQILHTRGENGAVREYLFDYQKVSKLLRDRDKVDLGTPAILPGLCSEPTPAILPGSSAILPGYPGNSAGVEGCYKEEEQERIKNLKTPIVPFLDYDDVVARYKAFRGLPRPKRSDIEQYREGWSVEISPGELYAALSAFQAAPAMKEKKHPFGMFAKDPRKWIPRDYNATQRDETPTEVVRPTPPVADASTVALVNSPPVDIVAAWNSVVTSGAPVEIWKPDQKMREDYFAAIGDSRFVENMSKILDRCQAAHVANPDGASWLTFRWMLANWPRILNGEIRWVSGQAKAGRAKNEKPNLVDRMKAFYERNEKKT